MKIVVVLTVTAGADREGITPAEMMSELMPAFDSLDDLYEKILSVGVVDEDATGA